MTYNKLQPVSDIFNATKDDGTVVTVEVTVAGLVKYSTTLSSQVSTIQLADHAAVKELFTQIGALL